MSVKVLYKDHIVGKIVHYENYYHFKYENTFLDLGMDLSPIMMPISKSRDKIYSFPNLNAKTFYGLPGLIADALPDNFGNQILNNWLASHGKSISDLSTLERLSYLGNRAMGALAFEPDEFIDKNLSAEAFLNLNELSDIAQKIIIERSQFNGSLNDSKAVLQLFEMGTSAGGARAKAVVAINDKTGEIVSGHNKRLKNFSSYIIKFDTISATTNKSTEVCLTEYAYYKMARKAGIDMMTTKLVEENGRFHFATKRFDRTKANTKIHIQTLCAIGHYDFRDFTHNSYENLFYVARKINVSYRDREQLFRRMILNVLARNQDDHTKNFAFLMKDNGKWKITPAYDINFNHDPKGLFTQMHKMSINGKVSEFKKSDLIELGRQNSIIKPELVFEEVKEAVLLFPLISKNIGISNSFAKYIFSTFRLDL